MHFKQLRIVSFGTFAYSKIMENASVIATISWKWILIAKLSYPTIMELLRWKEQTC